jgi:hypothetical protein
MSFPPPRVPGYGEETVGLEIHLCCSCSDWALEVSSSYLQKQRSWLMSDPIFIWSKLPDSMMWNLNLWSEIVQMSFKDWLPAGVETWTEKFRGGVWSCPFYSVGRIVNVPECCGSRTSWFLFVQNWLSQPWLTAETPTFLESLVLFGAPVHFCVGSSTSATEPPMRLWQRQDSILMVGTHCTELWLTFFNIKESHPVKRSQKS